MKMENWYHKCSKISSILVLAIPNIPYNELRFFVPKEKINRGVFFCVGYLFRGSSTSFFDHFFGNSHFTFFKLKSLFFSSNPTKPQKKKCRHFPIEGKYLVNIWVYLDIGMKIILLAECYILHILINILTFGFFSQLIQLRDL